MHICLIDESVSEIEHKIEGLCEILEVDSNIHLIWASDHPEELLECLTDHRDDLPMKGVLALCGKISSDIDPPDTDLSPDWDQWRNDETLSEHFDRKRRTEVDAWRGICQWFEDNEEHLIEHLGQFVVIEEESGEEIPDFLKSIFEIHLNGIEMSR